MTEKIKSEDFIKAFGNGVGAKVENIPMKLEVNSPIVIDCKYYLPCGRCDKTNGLCQMLEEPINIGISTKKASEYYPVNPSFYIPVNNNGVEPK